MIAIVIAVAIAVACGCMLEACKDAARLVAAVGAGNQELLPCIDSHSLYLAWY